MTSRLRHPFLILLAMASFCANAPGYAAPSQSQPIDIQADSLTVYEQESKAIFEGNVHVKQAEMTMQSNKMQILYKAAADGKQALDRIIAQGGVKISVPTRTATGQKAVYNAGQGTVKLEGNVTMIEGKNQLQGQRFTYNTRTKKSQLDGGNAPAKATAAGAQKSSPGRVRAIFTPKDKAE